GSLVPGVDRGADGSRLPRPGDVLHEVVKFPIFRERPDRKLVDRVAGAVAAIASAVRVASVGRRRHQDTDVADCRSLEGGERERHGSAVAVVHGPRGKGLPEAHGRAARVGFAAGPELDAIAFGVWLRPGDANRADWLQA